MTVPTVELDPGIRYLTATAESGGFVAKLNTDALRNRRFDWQVVVVTPYTKLNTIPMPCKLLFVCLGNICRSPSAENIMNHLIEQAGLSESIVCDSAGTGGF